MSLLCPHPSHWCPEPGWGSPADREVPLLQGKTSPPSYPCWISAESFGMSPFPAARAELSLPHSSQRVGVPRVRSSSLPELQCFISDSQLTRDAALHLGLGDMDVSGVPLAAWPWVGTRPGCVWVRAKRCPPPPELCARVPSVMAAQAWAGKLSLAPALQGQTGTGDGEVVGLPLNPKCIPLRELVQGWARGRG